MMLTTLLQTNLGIGLWTFHSQDVSFPIRKLRMGQFVRWTFRSFDVPTVDR